jgi:hypothetical protein
MQTQSDNAGLTRHAGAPATVGAGTDAVTSANPAGSEASDPGADAALTLVKPLPPEFGGRAGPEPTRFGDWEKNGRCIDF